MTRGTEGGKVYFNKLELRTFPPSRRKHVLKPRRYRELLSESIKICQHLDM